MSNALTQQRQDVKCVNDITYTNISVKHPGREVISFILPN